MTNEFYIGKMQSREPGFPLQIAQSEQSIINVEQIHINSAQDEENGVMSLNYELVLVLTNHQGTRKGIKITGVLTMIKVKEEWKVKYDKNNNLKDIINLVYKKS
ncbi:hypothetical protein [Paenibacillus silvisoli]|uniref:hypothetical protein n=1 Tax=Paenibacillus silvisoli TaxID=3110539 RepID=UPI0028047F72|nr:hypothetical protein [Paenibacillus silvisoli]